MKKFIYINIYKYFFKKFIRYKLFFLIYAIFHLQINNSLLYIKKTLHFFILLIKENYFLNIEYPIYYIMFKKTTN